MASNYIIHKYFINLEKETIIYMEADAEFLGLKVYSGTQALLYAMANTNRNYVKYVFTPTQDNIHITKLGKYIGMVSLFKCNYFIFVEVEHDTRFYSTVRPLKVLENSAPLTKEDEADIDEFGVFMANLNLEAAKTGRWSSTDPKLDKLSGCYPKLEKLGKCYSKSEKSVMDTSVRESTAGVCLP